MPKKSDQGIEVFPGGGLTHTLDDGRGLGKGHEGNSHKGNGHENHGIGLGLGHDPTNSPPVALDDPFATDEDTLFVGNVLANDSDPDGDSFSVIDSNTTSALGALVSFAADGTFTYDPAGSATLNALAAGETVSETFTYTISDGFGGTDSATVTVTVTGVNDAPVALDDENSTGVGSTASGNVLTNDLDAENDTLTVTGADTLSALGATVSVDADGNYLYDPTGVSVFAALAQGETLSDSFTYTISDGNGGSDTATVTVTVSGFNEPPTAVDDPVATDEDTPVTGDVLLNDTDPTFDILTVTSADTVSALGATVSVLSAGGFTYDPTGSATLQALAAGATTSDSFSYTITDEFGATDSATVTVTVTGVNDGPDALDDSAAATEDGGPVSISGAALLANDTDPDAGDTKSIIGVSSVSASGAAVSLVGGDVVYDLGGLFQSLGAGETTTDSFTYTMEDGSGATDSATVTVTITGVNDAPDALDDPFETDEDTLFLGNVLANDLDVDDDALTVTGATTASALGAVVTIAADGTFSYDPTGSSTLQALDAGATVSESFSYTISDPSGATSSATATIIVTGVNDAPSALGLTGFAVDENAPGVVVGTVDSVSDIDTNDFHSFTVDDARFEVVGTDIKLKAGESLDFEVASTVTLDITATDSGGLSVTAPVVVTVNDLPDEIGVETLDGEIGFRVAGGKAQDQSGHSVSSAGDINGDGFDDIIIGAPKGDQTGLLDTGISYVVFGKSTGFAPSLDLTALDGTDGFAIRGINDSDNSGFSVSDAGDINGDGLADLLVGASLADPNGGSSGQVYVVFGKDTAFSPFLDLATMTAADGFRIDGLVAADLLGFSISSAGDINGDGLDDLVVGAGSADSPGGDGIAGTADDEDQAGQTYVVFGSAGGFGTSVDLSLLDGSNGFVVNGIDAFDRSGRAVSSAGDINGDGIEDILIGAFNAAPEGRDRTGEAYVLFGKQSGFAASFDLGDLLAGNGGDGTLGFTISGFDVSDFVGISVSDAGDFNGDNIGDIIIGARRGEPGAPVGGSNAGQAYVVFGVAGAAPFGATFDLATLDGTNGFVIDGINVGDLLGHSVSSAGDINGDGYDDIIVGAVDADPDAIGDAGSAYVIYGAASGPSSPFDVSLITGLNGFVIEGANADDKLGTSVSDAGDVDGDGFDDVIIGASGADPNGTDSGAAYTIFGDDFLNVVDFLGTADDDTLTGDSGDNILIGGLGNDILDGLGGNDVLVGAAGDDVLVFDSADVRRVDGGGGFDTLRVGGGGTALDLSAFNVANHYGVIENIEVIDLVAGAGSDSLSLNLLDVLNVTNSEVPAGFTGKTLIVDGDASDTVTSTDTGWTNNGLVTLGAVDYVHYSQAMANLLVDSDIVQTIS